MTFNNKDPIQQHTTQELKNILRFYEEEEINEHPERCAYIREIIKRREFIELMREQLLNE